MLRRYRLALGLWICGVVMVFVAFISASIVRGGVPAYDSGAGAYSRQSESLVLSTPLLVLDSCVLIICALSLELARRRSRSAASAQQGPVRRRESLWLYAAIALGLAFLAGQAMVWRLLRVQGQSMSTSARAAFFYLLTGAHGLQIAAGVLVLAWILARQTSWTGMRRYIAVDLATWYFSAMTVLWLLLFCFLVFA